MPQSVPLMDASLHSISQYHTVWMRMAMKITSNDLEESKELVQEMYLRLYDFFEKKQVQSVSSLYVYKCILRIFFNRKSKVKKEFATNDMEVFECAEVHDDVLEARQMMACALDELPYLEREVLLLHQEKSQRQLQKDTNVCRDRLRLHKNRGMEKLKLIFNDKIKIA